MQHSKISLIKLKLNSYQVGNKNIALSNKTYNRAGKLLRILGVNDPLRLYETSTITATRQ